MTNKHKLRLALENQLSIVDEILTRYTNDELGESQKDKYLKMTQAEKINLLTITLLTCPGFVDFESHLVINFDYNNY